MESDWKIIEGPVTTYDYMGRQFVFDTLQEAIQYYPGFDESITDGDFSMRESVEWWNRGWKPCLPPYYCNDITSLLIIFDEMGVRIPAWRVISEYRKEKKRKKKRSYHQPERGSVVPWTGHCKRRYLRGKVARTFPEVRDNEFLYWDEELKEYGIRPRPVRTNYYLPNSYETRHYASDIRCWKRYRKSQWKVSRNG